MGTSDVIGQPGRKVGQKQVIDVGECTDIAQLSAIAIAISIAPPDNRVIV